jgi:membrane associated rhomboid family serine protease
MLPLKDDIPSRRFPAATLLLILANALVFAWELALGPYLDRLLLDLAIVPARYTVSGIREQFSIVEQALPFLSSMFLHGGWTHLIGNMWTLWIFGDNVEDELGRGRYLLLYLLGGLVAGLVHIATNASSVVPTIGASGAVAAVMGAYFRLHPHANVTMIFPPFIFGPYFVVPAIIFLGWWFILQFFNGTLSLLARPDRVGGIAWWAHIGGFVFGAMLCTVVELKHAYRRRRRPKDTEVLPW